MNCCRLPIALKSLCETGCIYRTQVLSHLACRLVPKPTCVAPCAQPCDCSLPPPRNGGSVIERVDKRRHYTE